MTRENLFMGLQIMLIPVTILLIEADIIPWYSLMILAFLMFVKHILIPIITSSKDDNNDNDKHESE